MSEVAKARLHVIGRVQGVFYRQSTKDTARSLGLGGWVKNENDGSVAAEVIGPKHAVEKLIAWCHKGPPSARVDRVHVEWLEPAPDENATRFDIR